MKELDFKKIKKIDHQIWILYDREILYTSFNSRLKGEKPTIFVFFISIS